MRVPWTRPPTVPVSVVVPVKNEGEISRAAWSRSGWASEMFVVDSGAPTGRGARRIDGGAVVQFQNGPGPKKKNWALEKLPFRHQWVLLLDADETLAADAETRFAAWSPRRPHVRGYWINRRFLFMGRWLRHAYYPNWNMRLFQHRSRALRTADRRRYAERRRRGP